MGAVDGAVRPSTKVTLRKPPIEEPCVTCDTKRTLSVPKKTNMCKSSYVVVQNSKFPQQMFH